MTDQTIKACLFNLIIYTHESRRREYLHHIVHSIVEKFPCRIIFIELEKSQAVDFLNVTETSEPTDHEKGISCDQITINASSNHISQIPFIVLQHIVPDLPVYLLWGQNPASDNPLFNQLLKFANRLVFDAECTENLQHFSKQILSQLSKHPIDIMDVDWAFLSRWRYIISQIFSTPQRLEQLNEATSIQITYNHPPDALTHHHCTRAIFFQGWLASRMQWKCKKIESDQDKKAITYQTPHNQCTVTLNPKTVESIAPSAILDITFESSEGRNIGIQRSHTQPKVTVHITNHNRCELPYTLPLLNPQQGLSFMKEIFFYSPSDHYRKMLEMISEQCW